MLDMMGILSRGIRPPISTSDTLASFAALGVRTTRAHACAIYLTQPSRNDARLAAVAPADERVPDHRATREIERIGSALATQPDGPRPFPAQPIVSGIERMGTLVLFDNERSSHGEDEVATCSLLADAIALALQQRAIPGPTVERARSVEHSLRWRHADAIAAENASRRSRLPAGRRLVDRSEPPVRGSYPVGYRQARDTLNLGT